MKATLNSMIRYENGYITIIETLPKPMKVKSAEIVERNCKGWGASNAVVKFNGCHYLATV